MLSIAVASFIFSVSAIRGIGELRSHTPVLVVPGAVGGVYSPGLTEDSIRAVARYLTGLGTNFGGARSFREHFDEIEVFSSPNYLPRLQRARAVLAHDVETQNQSRAFFTAPATEIMQQPEPGRFAYSIRGERIVYASGIPMDTRQSEARLWLRWGVPSPKNRSGIALDSFDVADVPAGDAPDVASHS
jgi:hypothetical protein